MTTQNLIELIGNECRRSDARSRVLYELGVALRKLDDGESDAISTSDKAIEKSRRIIKPVEQRSNQEATKCS